MSIRKLPSFVPTPAELHTKKVGYYPRMPRLHHMMRSGELTAGGIHRDDHSGRSRFAAGGRSSR